MPDATEPVLGNLGLDEYHPTAEQMEMVIGYLVQIAPKMQAKLDYMVLMGVGTATELGGMSAAAEAAARYMKTQLRAMSEVSPNLEPPEGLCGVDRKMSVRTLIDAEDVLVTTSACVFLPNHEGKHSWEQ